MPATRKIMGVGRNAITRMVGPTVDTNDKVAVTNTDSTPDYLWNKITAGTNVTFTLVGGGGDESITIESAGGGGGGGTTNWATGSNDSLYHANPVGVGFAQASSTAGVYPFSVRTNSSGPTIGQKPMVYIKNDSSTGASPAVLFASDNATTTWFQVGINQTSHSTHPDWGYVWGWTNTPGIRFGAANAESMVISGSNVGIGITEPREGRLQIYRTDTIGGAGGTMQNAALAISTVNSVDAANADGFYIDENEIHQVGDHFNLYTETADKKFRFFVSDGSEVLTITPAGGVGVNTTSPTKNFEVWGTAKVSGNFYVGEAGQDTLITLAGSSAASKVTMTGNKDIMQFTVDGSDFQIVGTGSAANGFYFYKAGTPYGKLRPAAGEFTIMGQNSARVSITDDTGAGGIYVEDGVTAGLYVTGASCKIHPLGAAPTETGSLTNFGIYGTYGGKVTELIDGPVGDFITVLSGTNDCTVELPTIALNTMGRIMYVQVRDASLGGGRTVTFERPDAGAYINDVQDDLIIDLNYHYLFTIIGTTPGRYYISAASLEGTTP